MPALCLLIFSFYFLPYAIRHLRLPIGFDPPWYIWHGQYLAERGIGHGLIASRPGYPLLSVVLGRITGRSQLEMAAILPILLVAMFALTVGALARLRLGWDRSASAVLVLATAALLGPTDLVGENLASALTATFGVGAILLLTGGGGRSLSLGAFGLLVAAGLTHWDFLAVIDVVLLAWVLLSLRASSEERRDGTPLWGTEAGRIALVGGAASAILLVVVLWVLRAPVVTIELAQNSAQYLQKFLGREFPVKLIPAMAGGLVLVIMDACLPAVGEPPPRGQASARRAVRAWAYAMVAGIVLGLITLAIPPARFLDLLVAFPGAVAVGAAIVLVGRQTGTQLGLRRGRRAARAGAVVAVAAALAILSAGAAIRWYRYPVWLSSDAVRQAEAADRYIDTLGSDPPVVFVLTYTPTFAQAVAAQERAIRVGLSPQHDLGAYFFVGDPADLLAGRRTEPPDGRSDDVTRPYWEALRRVLPEGPPVFVLESLAPRQYRQAATMGGHEIAPGIQVLGGRPPPSPIPLPPAPDAVPPLPIALGWGLAVLGLLVVAGAGWSRSILGSGDVALGMAPVLGAAALILSGFVVDEFGLRLGEVGGPVAFLLATGSGMAVALWKRGRARRLGDPAQGRTKITPSSSS